MSDKIKKLSQAIRLGATFHPQTRLFYSLGHDSKICASCAITAAAFALNCLEEDEMPTGYQIIRRVAERLVLDETTVAEVSFKHFTSVLTREQVADQLEAQGL